jgi:hypothetical protein
MSPVLEFKWDDVKNDKYRENYLGHSVNAPVGRWQKGKYYYRFSIRFVDVCECVCVCV